MQNNDAFQLIGTNRTSAFVVLCDHASNIVPSAINNGDLGLPPQDMARHIAYDIGAAGLSIELGALLDAPVLLSKFSRLVIDPNRGETDPTLIMQLYDGSIIPANRDLNDEMREARLQAFHRPYRQAAQTLVSQRERPIIVSIHSFTPQLAGRPKRPWEIGVLFSDDERFSKPLIETFETTTNYTVGKNQPYSGHLPNDTMDVIALQKHHLHALIEVRNDLIEQDSDQKAWAQTLAKALTTTSENLS